MSKKRSDDECRSIAQDKDKMRDNPTGCKAYNAKALKEILEECIPGYQYQNKDIACNEFLGNFGSKAKKTKATPLSAATVTTKAATSAIDIKTASKKVLKDNFTIPELKKKFSDVTGGLTISKKLKDDVINHIYDHFHKTKPSPVQTPISTPKVSQIIPTPKPTPSVSEISETSESENYTKDELEKMLKPDLNKIAKGMGISFLKRTKENIINDILDKQKPMESVEVAEEVIFPVKNEVWEYAEKISKIDKEQFEDMGNEINKVSDVFDEVNESMADYITKKYPNEFEDILNFYENHENVIDEMRIRELRDYIRLEHPDSYAKLYGEVPEETVSEVIPEIVPEVVEEPVKEGEIPPDVIKKIEKIIIDKYIQFDREEYLEQNRTIEEVMESTNNDAHDNAIIEDLEPQPFIIDGYSPDIDELVEIDNNNSDKRDEERIKSLKKLIGEKDTSKEMKRLEKLRQKLINEGIILSPFVMNSELDELIKNECDENNPCPKGKLCFVKNNGESGYCIGDIDDADGEEIPDFSKKPLKINGNLFVGSSRALDILEKRYKNKSKKPEVKEIPIQAPVQIEEEISEEEEPAERLTTEDIEDVLEKMTTKDTHDELRKSIAKCIGLL